MNKKALTKNISSLCKCKYNARKFNSNQKWNNSKCQCEGKNLRNHHMYKKDYIWNPSRCTYQNGELLRVFKLLFHLLLLLNYFNYLGGHYL